VTTSTIGSTPEISALQLATALEHGDPPQVVDVRSPARVAAGRIDSLPEGRRNDRSVGAVLSQLLEKNDALRVCDREAFTRWVLARTASFPQSYRTIKAINVGLLRVDNQAEELQVGRNECALG
jgi:hypothetical protein